MKNLNETLNELIDNSESTNEIIDEGFIDTLKNILNSSNKKSDPKQYVSEISNNVDKITDSIKSFDKINGDAAKKFLSSFKDTVNKVSDILWKSDNENDKQLILDLWENVDKLYDIFNLYSKKLNEVTIK